MFFFLLFPLAAFGEAPPLTLSEAEKSINLLESLFSASPIVQLTFLILLVMSIVSWAVILQKWVVFKKASKENKSFEDIFLKYHSFEDIYSLARSHETSSLANIFSSGYEEMRKILNPEGPDNPSTIPVGEDNIERALQKKSMWSCPNWSPAWVFLQRLEVAVPLSVFLEQFLALWMLSAASLPWVPPV